MDRRQREAELRTMLTSPQGQAELLAIYKRHVGEAEGNSAPPENVLIQTILNFEYQTQGAPQQGRQGGAGDEPRQPGSEKKEPGDAKFAQPPASEALGG